MDVIINKIKQHWLLQLRLLYFLHQGILFPEFNAGNETCQQGLLFF